MRPDLDPTPILDAYRALLDAWNRRDARAFAAAFTLDGSSVGFDGSQMNGRDEIERTVDAIFRDHQTATYRARVREIRPLSSSVVLLRSVVGMVPPGSSTLNPAANAVQSLVFTADGPPPRIALLHNTPAAYHGRPHLVDELTRELTSVLERGVLVDADEALGRG